MTGRLLNAVTFAAMLISGVVLVLAVLGGGLALMVLTP